MLYKGETIKEKRARQHVMLVNHIKELKAIGYKYDTMKPLRTLENKANRLCTLECNEGVMDFDSQIAEIGYKVKQLFDKPLIGFFINQDPRGYALKLETNTGALSYRDWGGYEILTPELKEI